MSGPRRSEGRVSYSVLVWAVVIAAVVLGLLARTWLWHGGPANEAPAADDPNSLKLQYVRPDYGREVYDAAGELIGTVPVMNPYMRTHWDADEMARQFVFTCRVDGEDPLFWRRVSLSLNGGTSRAIAWLRPTDSGGGWYTLSCESALPRSIRQPSFSLIIFSIPRSPIPVHTVDAEIRYFAGPRGPAAATYTGPFQAYKTYRATENEKITLECVARVGSSTNLHIVGPAPMDSEAPIILYLRDGQRILAGSRSGSTSSSRGFDWTVSQLDVTLGAITHITIDEKPKTQVFRNIVVDYPGRPHRTYPESFEEIAARLDLDVDLTSPESIDKFANDKSFLKTPSDALRILDIAQGQHLAHAMETLKEGSIPDLSEAEQEQLRSILDKWLETDREIAACHLGLWAGWPDVIDRIPPLLRAGDLNERPLRELAQKWGRKAPRQPKTLRAMTDLLLEENILDASVHWALVDAVRRAGEDGEACVQKLAECDKPWIWERIIQPDSLFRDWKEKHRLSEKVRARMTALGMNDWVNDAEGVEDEARAVLCSMLTPEYVQKGGNVYDWFRQFEKLVEPERGTEVLVRYLQAQLQQWHTWQVEGRSSRNHTGIRLAVQQLNRRHGLNLGGLGSDRNKYGNSDYRFNWQNIIRETLYWARTGRDPRELPADWLACEDDLRIVWFNKTSPELSMIALWPANPDPNIPVADTVMEMVDDYLQFTIAPQPDSIASNRLYDFVLRAGKYQRSSTGRTLTFRRSDLPTALDPGQSNTYGTSRDGTRRRIPIWKGTWEIWVESATGGDSVIEDTVLFQSWQKQYLSASPIPRDRVFHKTSQEGRFQYILDRRDYSGMSDAEIALRKAMDWDPKLSSDELKEYKEDMPRLGAVERYQKLLQRDDLPVEAQIFAWSRIARLSRPSSPRPDQNTDPADNWGMARHAFQQAITLDPNWVSPTTLSLQQRRTFYAARGDDQISCLLDAYEWLLTRTEAMVESSARRPKINRSPAGWRSMLAGASKEYAEREKAQLVRGLSQQIESTRRLIGVYDRRSQNIFDKHRDRRQRLGAMDEEHWSHTYGENQ